MKTTQYTVRGISEAVDRQVRRVAAREGQSLNAVVLGLLKRGLGISEEPIRYHDLDDLAGSWVQDPEFDRAVEAMDTVDKELWR